MSPVSQPSSAMMKTDFFSKLFFAALLLTTAGWGCRERSGNQQPAVKPFALALVSYDSRTAVSMRVIPGAVVLLDGSRSGTTGGGGRAGLSYAWRQTSGPRARIFRPRLATTEIRLARSGRYCFELVTSVAGLGSQPSRVTVTVSPDAGVGTGDSGEGSEKTSTNKPDKTDPAAVGGRADFALFRSNAEELIRVFPAATGITLRVDPAVMRPEALAAIPVTFLAHNISGEASLEIAARLIGLHYVRDGIKGAFLTTGTAWLHRKPEITRIYPLGGVPGGTAKATRLVRECLRGVLFASGKKAVKFHPKTVCLHITAPALVHKWVRSLLASLSSNADSLAARPRFSPDEIAEKQLRSTRIEMLMLNRDLSNICLKLSSLLGVPVVWQQTPARAKRPLPRLSLRGGGRSAEKVLTEVARGAGFKGWSWIAGGGVWFYNDRPVAASARHPWIDIEVRSYPMAELKRRGILPGGVVHGLKKCIAPASWKNSATLCQYYKGSDSIIVLQSPPGHRQILRYLHDLLKKK
jgi:hypothetical protein